MQASAAVFVLQGFSQNIPPLIAANGRCACLCINRGAVNLSFNRRGSRAGNYFWMSNCADKEKEKHRADRQPWREIKITCTTLCPPASHWASGHSDHSFMMIFLVLFTLIESAQCLLFAKFQSHISFKWKLHSFSDYYVHIQQLKLKHHISTAQ